MNHNISLKIFDHLGTELGAFLRLGRGEKAPGGGDEPGQTEQWTSFIEGLGGLIEVVRPYRPNKISCCGSSCHPEQITVRRICEPFQYGAPTEVIGYIIQQKSKRKYGLWIIDSKAKLL